MNDATEFEPGPITRMIKAEAKVEELEKKLDGQRLELDALEHQRQKDNEHALERQGELQCEIDRLSGIETLCFTYGSHLKFLVTAACPVIQNREMLSEEQIKQWDNFRETWEEARDQLTPKVEANQSGDKEQ